MKSEAEKWGPNARAAMIAAARDRQRRMTAAPKPKLEPPPFIPPVMPPRVARIVRACAARHEVSVEDIFGRSRKKEIVKARHLAAYLCRKMLKLSYPRIGLWFGRDHAAVLAAIRKIDWLVASDPELAADIDRLMDQVEA